MANEPNPQVPPTGGTPNPTPPGGNPSNPPPVQPPKGDAPPPGAPPPGAPPSKPKGSIYDDAGVDPPDVKGSATWPDDWRSQMAGGDEKIAKQLERYQNPQDLGKALLSIRQRISSGEYKRAAPPEGADPKAVDAWREENGIPIKPEEYPIEVEGKPVDLKALDEPARAAVATIQQTLHGLNLTKEQGSQVAKLFVDIGTKQAEQMALADATSFDANDDDLRAAWGSDYRPNVQANWAFMKSTFGEDFAGQLIEARLPDGTKLANVPGFNKAINQIARTVNGGDTLFAGTSEAKGVESRIAQIEQIMRTDYNKYVSDDAMVKEYGELLAKRPAKQ